MEALTHDRLDEFLKLLGEGVTLPVKLYLLGGSVMFLLGSNRETVDLDYWIEPSPPDVRKYISALSNELRIDAEEVPLHEFVPIPSGQTNATISSPDTT